MGYDGRPDCEIGDVNPRLDALLNAVRHDAHRRRSDWAPILAREILDACHPRQRDFVADPGKRIAALVGGRGGKTTGGRARLARRALLTPGARCLFVATTRVHAEDLMWTALKELFAEIPAHFHETKLTCRLPFNGSEIKLVGADDKREIEKLRGVPRHEVGIDEAASFPVKLLEHLIDRVIVPRLGDYDGALWLIGTPSHVLSGLFYDATRDGSPLHRPYEERDDPRWAGFDGWSFHRWALPDAAPFVPAIANAWDAALREKQRKGYSDDNPVWVREYLGRWAADDTENIFRYRPHVDGQPYNQWDPERDPRTGIAALPPAESGDWRFVYGMDLGAGDPMALVVLAYNPQARDRTLYHVFDFERVGMYPRTIAELLIGPNLDAANPGGLIGATGWPDAMVADMAHLGGAILDELANVYGIRILPAQKKHKFDAIEMANGDLIDGRVKVLKGSRLESQMLHLQWTVDDFGALKEPRGQPNHATDAFIYARRAALHLFDEDPPAPAPPHPQSAEALALREMERFERPRDAMDTLLAPVAFDDDPYG